MKREIARLEQRIELADARTAKMAGFVRPGEPVWYEASPGQRFSAVVDSDPRELGKGQMVVRLRDLDASYVEKQGRSTIPAAATWCLEPRVVEKKAGFPELKAGETYSDDDYAAAANNIANDPRWANRHDAQLVARWALGLRGLLDEVSAISEMARPQPDSVDSMVQVHEAHRLLLARRATELLKEIRPLWIGAHPNEMAIEVKFSLMKRIRDLVDDIAGLPERPNVEPQVITEEDSRAIIDTWYTRKPQNALELAIFVDQLITHYRHDYGTIMHAVAAAALAAAHAMNASPQGRLSGAQASVIPFEFWRQWMHLSDVPLSFRKLEDMLYPQNADMFRTITLDTFGWLQKRAAELLAEGGAHEKVKAHWQNIVDGEVPFGYQVKD
jgi:hypothetical protein